MHYVPQQQQHKLRSVSFQLTSLRYAPLNSRMQPHSPSRAFAPILSSQRQACSDTSLKPRSRLDRPRERIELSVPYQFKMQQPAFPLSVPSREDSESQHQFRMQQRPVYWPALVVDMAYTASHLIVSPASRRRGGRWFRASCIAMHTDMGQLDVYGPNRKKRRGDDRALTAPLQTMASRLRTSAP